MRGSGAAPHFSSGIDASEHPPKHAPNSFVLSSVWIEADCHANPVAGAHAGSGLRCQPAAVASRGQFRGWACPEWTRPALDCGRCKRGQEVLMWHGMHAKLRSRRGDECGWGGPDSPYAWRLGPASVPVDL